MCLICQAGFKHCDARTSNTREQCGTQWISEVLVETKIDLNYCQTMISDNFLYFVVKEYKENYYV